MIRSVTATDASRRFSQLLQEVHAGRSVTVTKHGRGVAKLTPPDQPDQTAVAAHRMLIRRLRQQLAAGAALSLRDQLYEDRE
jgi:prevent-host-death family protein